MEDENQGRDTQELPRNQFSPEKSTKYAPSEAKIKEWCTKYTCRVNLDILNIYKALQVPKFKRSMETTEEDREKYHRYLKVRASYYYFNRNENLHGKVADQCDRRRRAFFNLIWLGEQRQERMEKEKQKKAIVQTIDDSSSETEYETNLENIDIGDDIFTPVQYDNASEPRETIETFDSLVNGLFVPKDTSTQN